MCRCWSRRGVIRPIAAVDVNIDCPDNAEYRRVIRFVLDGETIEVESADPTRTVLQYLREDLRKVGSKEGCAEGDCGACTVVVAELDATGKTLRKRAINSCIQFLPTLDGKALYTVESLARPDGTLHPVQQALVESHGSQCGFCTPGFVMSLYALYENHAADNHDAPTRREIDEALAGNLCRCTGYRPIIDAATKMFAAERATSGEHRLIPSLRALQAAQTLTSSGHGRQFFAPTSSAQLAALLQLHPTATLLAGGTDVGLWVTKQHRDLGIVVYTGKVAELVATSMTATHIEIGAAVTLTDAMQAVVAMYPSLSEVFVRFASPPIRNAATLGGNIANGSPIGDSMPALLVLDAVLQLRCGADTRRLPLQAFYLDYQETALQQAEFIEKILVPLPEKGEFVASYKVSKRFDQDIAALCGAYRVRLEGDSVTDIRIAYGGMAATPKRAATCERSLHGNRWSGEAVEAACDRLQKDFSPLSDMRASAAYRQLVAQNLLRRFYQESTAGGAVRVYDYGR